MWVVFKKEIKELVRDKKTMFFMIALPILFFPVIIGITTYFSSKAISEAESKVLKLSIVNSDYASDISEALAQSEFFNIKPIPEGVKPEDWVKEENVDFVIAMPQNYSQRLLEGGQMAFTIYLNDAGFNRVTKRLKEVLDPFVEAQQKEAFATLNLDDEQQTALLKPMELKKVDVADKRENVGEKIGGFIPYLLFILCLQGAMIPATDLGAGEKERGTLETLLLSPIERHQLVLGKFFAIALAGVTSALITVFSMAVWGIVLSQGMAIKFVTDFMGAISALDFILIFLMLVPVVSIFSSVLLSLSVYARSFKEAQGYMAPLMFIVIVPIIMSLLPGVELKGGWAWVPLTNVSLAIKELVKGTMDYFQLIAIFVSTAAIAAGALGFSVFWFNKEKVLFR
jgi:sodium transport system permease protein